MISQFDNVKISYMLHRIICQAERDLKNITKLPPFLQKAQLIKKLLISSVRFARFLVIYRWWKYNIHINKNHSNSKCFSYMKIYQEIKNQIKSFRKQTQGKRQNIINIKQQFMDYYNLNQLSQTFLYKSNNNREKMFQNLYLFLDNYKENTHIQSIYVIKKYIFINAHPYYQLILKIKNHFCSINRLKINWDKNFKFPSEYLERIVSHLNHIDLAKPKELSRIDSYIFSFYIICFFCKIVNKLIEISESFNCQILRELNNSILIIFPKTFQPFNQFILRINSTMNNIEIFSKTPLFQPPKDARIINEEFGKLDIDIYIPMKIYSIIIDITKEFNGLSFLSELHDFVFYTNVRRFWFFLKRETRLTVLPIFKIFLRCNFNSIYSILIHLNDKRMSLFSIAFRSIDGLPIFIPISNYYRLNNLDVQPVFIDANKIFTSIFIYFTSHIDFLHIFKPHILSLMRKFELVDSLDYKINFSFSDDFFIVKRNLVLFPTLTLRSVDSPKNLNPRTLLIKQIIKARKGPNEFDQLMTNLSITSKIYIILFELERKLKSKGIVSKRILNSIYIPTMGCKFKIDLNEYWSICFEKLLIYGVSNGRVIITGNKLTLRFVDSILNILNDWHKFCSLIYTYRHYIVFTDDSKMYLKSFGYHICIIYEPYLYDNYLDANNITHCFKVLPFEYPSSHMKVMMYTPFSNFAQHLNKKEDISSYFSCLIYYQLKLIEIFKSDKWKVVPFFDEESFTLVYKSHLSMTFHIYNYNNDFHLTAYIFMIGHSSLLLVPLSNIFKICENNTPVVTIKMLFCGLEKVKKEIEKYDGLIKLFKLLKIDHLFYNNGKVIGKGTRFYLIQAAFDLNGLILSSPSFPSLINITTAVYNLKISFESKKKIYNFISSILLFDEKYIVKVLSILKELIKPNRIQNLNWDEMSNYTKIDSTKLTLEIVIIENQNMFYMILDDPVSQSILIRKDQKEKRFSSNEFDNVYLHLNPELPIYSQFII